MPADDKKEKGGLAKLIERLHDPVQLRVFITGIMVVVGYMGIYSQLSEWIEESTRELSRLHKRQGLAKEIEFLRCQLGKFDGRLAENADPNEWAQYLIDNIRKFPLRLLSFRPESPRPVGPYTALVFDVTLAGEKIRDLDSFVHWVETNKRLLRVDSLRIAPTPEGRELIMNLRLLGIRS